MLVRNIYTRETLAFHRRAGYWEDAGTGPDAKAPIPKLHYASEQFMQTSCLQWTLLQPNFFKRNLMMNAATIAAKNEFSLLLGTAKTALIGSDDVGAVAARVLSTQGHDGWAYVLTGSELLSFHAGVGVISRVLGREIRYVDQPRPRIGRCSANSSNATGMSTRFASFSLESKQARSQRRPTMSNES